MDTLDREILWRQFGAAIDMLAETLRDCPDRLWTERLWEDRARGAGFSTFWYVAYHTLFWLDLYLTGEEEERFAPPNPFDLIEMDPEDVLPRIYNPDELLGYLAYCRDKCRSIMTTLTNEQAYRICRYPWGEVPYVELQLYNLRHVQEHGAQLRLFLGQRAGLSAGWEAQAE